MTFISLIFIIIFCKSSFLQGWMITLVDGDSYTFLFEDVDHVTNISYTGRLDDFQDGDFVLLGHNFTQVPDMVSITGDIRNSSKDVPTYEDNVHGDWHFDEEDMQLNYLGKNYIMVKKVPNILLVI